MGGLCIHRIRSSRSSDPPVRTRFRGRPRERGGECGRVEVRRHSAPMESRRQGTLLHHAGDAPSPPFPCAFAWTVDRLADNDSFHAPGIGRDWGVAADGNRFLVMAPEAGTTSTSFSLIFDWQGSARPPAMKALLPFSVLQSRYVEEAPARFRFCAAALSRPRRVQKHRPRAHLQEVVCDTPATRAGPTRADAPG